MTVNESLDFALALLVKETQRLDQVMQFIQLVASGDARAHEILVGLGNGQIDSEDAPVVLGSCLDQRRGC